MPSRRVYEEIDLWGWVAILWACLIQVCEVHPPFAIGFFNHHYIGQPVRVVDIPNESYLQ